MDKRTLAVAVWFAFAAGFSLSSHAQAPASRTLKMQFDLAGEQSRCRSISRFSAERLEKLTSGR